MQQQGFVETYGALQQRARTSALQESAEMLEMELQLLWQCGAFRETLETVEGHRVRVLAPGWLNKSGGPDFRSAQIEFNGEVFTGDVEMHRRIQDWYDHHHDEDPAYNEVVLHVVNHAPRDNTQKAITQNGRVIATLVWPGDDAASEKNALNEIPERCGKCAPTLATEGLLSQMFLALAGEWRMLEKQRHIRARIQQVGPDQAIYEAFMSACGYSSFKEQFLAVAQALPYDRVRQLAQQTPELLEVALLRIAGLLPTEWPHETEPPAHYIRSVQHLNEHLAGLGALELSWHNVNSRPVNNPERRLVGAARFLTRTADFGLHKTLELIWRASIESVVCRRKIEAYFGNATGFWANHCSWQGAPMKRSSAPLGSGRIRTIIGNALIPAALAWAREQHSAVLEENLRYFFVNLPAEPENHIHRTMQDWLFAGKKPFRIKFCHQQGLMQMHQDWCVHNMACRNCTLLMFLRLIEGHA